MKLDELVSKVRQELEEKTKEYDNQKFLESVDIILNIFNETCKVEIKSAGEHAILSHLVSSDKNFAKRFRNSAKSRVAFEYKELKEFVARLASSNKIDTNLIDDAFSEIILDLDSIIESNSQSE